MLEELTLREEYGVFHDLVLGATGVHLSYERLDPLWKKLPDDLKELAARWGLNEPITKDKIYLHLQKIKML